MNNMLKLSGSIGPDDDDDNKPDDIRKMQNGLTEIGRTPFHRSFREDEHPGNEIERFQLDKDLQIDGRARPGGETERTLNNELLRKRDEDKRTRGGLLSDPRIGKPVGFGEVGKSNTVQDIRRSENTLTRLGFAPRNEPMPTDLMRASAIGKSLIDLQSSAGLDADGVMNPGGPTEREVTRRLDEKKQLAKAAADGLKALKGAGNTTRASAGGGGAVNPPGRANDGIFERLFAPALAGVAGTGQETQVRRAILPEQTSKKSAQNGSRNAPEELASNHFTRGYTPQNRLFVPKPPKKPAAYDGRAILLGELKSRADDIARRKSLGSLDLNRFVQRAASEISSRPGNTDRNAIATRLLQELDAMMPNNDPAANALKSRIEAGIRRAGASPASSAVELILTEAIGTPPANAAAGLVALEKEVASWVPHFRKEGSPFLADMIQKWLSGDNSTVVVDPTGLHGLEDMREAEGRIQLHFQNWISNKRVPKATPSEILHPQVENMSSGQSIERTSRWDTTFVLDAFSPFSDAGMTINRTSMSGTGDFKFRKHRGGVAFSGRVTFRWADDFDWDKGKIMLVPTRKGWVDQSLVHALKRHGRARDFDMISVWRKSVQGKMRLEDGVWKIVSINWK